MKRYYTYSPALYRIAIFPWLLVLGSCAVTGSWQLKKETDNVQVYMQEYPDSGIPEFRASIKIHSNIQKIMMVLTNFSGYPDWVYMCKSARVVDLVDFTESYIYQVMDLPLVRDRDIVIHGKTIPGEDGKEMLIKLNAAPDYCDNKNSEVCRIANDSGLVRITHSVGSFHLIETDSDQVKVTWRLHFDPGGAIPDWTTRLMLDSVPVNSLRKLKEIVER